MAILYSELHAQEAISNDSAKHNDFSFASLVPLILIFAIFYFFIIRPQTKRQKEHQEKLSNLKIGNEIITTSGIHAKVKDIFDETIEAEISDNVIIKLQKNSISDVVEKNKNNKTDKKNK